MTRRVYRYCHVCSVGFYERDPECWLRVPYDRGDQKGVTTIILCGKCQAQLREMLQ